MASPLNKSTHRPNPQLQQGPHDEKGHDSQKVTDDLPSDVTVKECGEVAVYDANAQPRPFRELYAGVGKSTMVIFVRHFFCGMCQDFLRSLSADISLEDLRRLGKPTTLVIVGCGEASLINDYVSYSKCPFPVYAEPSRTLYDKFGMTSTFSQGPTKPEYQTSSLGQVMAKSFVQVVSAGSQALKGGSFSQVGGDFLFEDGKPVWCHRMRNTRDHTSIPEIKRLLGL